MSRTVVTEEHYKELKHRFLRGATWRELAASHFVRTNKLPRKERNLYARMKCYAERIGDEWPWDPSRTTCSDRTRARNYTHYASGSAELIMYELKDFREASGMTYVDIAKEAGLHQATVWKLAGGFTPRVSRQTATKIMRVIEKHERRLAA